MKKKLPFYSIFIFLLFIIIYSCGKRNDLFSASDSLEIDNIDLESAKIFFSKGATLNPQSYNSLFASQDKILQAEGSAPKKHYFFRPAPLWKESFGVTSYDGTSLLVVPTKENALKEGSIKIRRFYIFTQKSNAISDGKIVEFLGKNYSLDENVKTLIANYKNTTVANLTGALFTYDLNYFQLSGERYINGKRTGEASHLENMIKANTSGGVKTTLDYCSSCDPGVCYALYWCWTTNGRFDDCIFTGYSDGCYSTPWTGGGTPGGSSGYDSSSNYSGGGGGPYGGNGPTPVNQRTPKEIFDEADSNPDNTLLSIIDATNTSTASGNREQDYKWIFVKNKSNFWHGTSTERGVHKWINDRFEWVSLTHQSTSIVGTIIGVTIDVSLNSSTPVILNPRSAYMELNYHQKMSILYNNSPMSTENDFTATSDVWNVH